MWLCLVLLAVLVVGWFVRGSMAASTVNEMYQLRWPTFIVDDDDGLQFDTDEVFADFEKMLLVDELTGLSSLRVYELRRSAGTWEVREEVASRQAWLADAERERARLVLGSRRFTETAIAELRLAPTWQPIKSHSLGAELEAAYQRFARSYKPVTWRVLRVEAAIQAKQARRAQELALRTQATPSRAPNEPLGLRVGQTPPAPTFEPHENVCGNCKLWRPHSLDAQKGWVGECRVQPQRGLFAPSASTCGVFASRVGVVEVGYNTIREFKCPSCDFQTDPSRHAWGTLSETGACPSCKVASVQSQGWALPR